MLFCLFHHADFKAEYEKAVEKSSELERLGKSLKEVQAQLSQEHVCISFVFLLI
jgi:hypothetical protein